MGCGIWERFRAGGCHPKVRADHLTSRFAVLLYVTCDWTPGGTDGRSGSFTGSLPYVHAPM